MTNEEKIIFTLSEILSELRDFAKYDLPDRDQFNSTLEKTKKLFREQKRIFEAKGLY